MTDSVVQAISCLPLLVTPTQAARLTGCSAKHIRDLCAAGTLKAVKSGSTWRINRDALLQHYGLLD